MNLKALTVKRLLIPSAFTTTTQGAAVDLQGSINPGVHNMIATFDIGSITGTAGTTLSIDAKIQESDTTTAADFTDIVTPTTAAITQVTSAAPVASQTIAFVTNKRYVRAVLTAGTTVTGAVVAAYVIRENRLT